MKSPLIVRLACLFLITALTDASAEVGSSDDPAQSDEIQVLLQGDDPQVLLRALEAAGGTLTHELPVVSGIGGTLLASQLPELREASGVSRVVEDFNPVIPPEPRECIIDGGLEAALHGNRLGWPVFNFSATPVAMTHIAISYPSTLGAVSLVNPLSASVTTMTSEGGKTVLKLEDGALPPGKTQLELHFEGETGELTQNAFDLSVTAENCEAKLLPAYPDNQNDFYYASVTGASQLHSLGITGQGINVAVIDSGLWESAAPLRNNTRGEPRVVARFDAISGLENQLLVDESGHGSHMASVLAHSGVAGTDEERRFKGIAPDAGLVPVKVFDASGNGDFLDILRGIQWVLENRERYNIRIMNLSLAAEPRFPYWEDPINQAVMKAWQAGIVVVAAAGNEGPEWGSVGSPGNNPYIITVGAVTDSWTSKDYSDDYIPDFSSRGPTQTGHVKPDLVAPGGHMTGITPPNSTMATDNPNWFLASGDFVSTGSSQSAAVVAGISALLLQVDTSLTNENIKCLLTTSARPAINRNGKLSYSPFTQGSGYVDAARALTLGEKQCGATPGNIDAAVAGTEELIGPTEVGPTGEPLLPGAENLVSTTDAAKGASDDRRWGVKAHIERLDIAGGEPSQTADSPVDWGAIYESERKAILKLQKPAPSHLYETQKPKKNQNPSLPL